MSCLIEEPSVVTDDALARRIVSALRSNPERWLLLYPDIGDPQLIARLRRSGINGQVLWIRNHLLSLSTATQASILAPRSEPATTQATSSEETASTIQMSQVLEGNATDTISLPPSSTINIVCTHPK